MQPNVTIASTLRRLTTLFRDSLERHPTVAQEVEGFTEYDFLGFPCRNPVQIDNLLNNKFIRNFHTSLQTTINEIYGSDEVDQTAVDPILLEKYGISHSANTRALPNALATLPSEEAPDYQLQLYFLQPFRLFGITDSNRKHFSNDIHFMNRQWMWDRHNHDSAPLFRTIIQLYLVANILERKTQEGRRQELDQKYEVLYQKAQTQLNTLLNAVEARGADLEAGEIEGSGGIEGSPEGFFSYNNVFGNLLRTWPDFMDIASFYPIGRLLLGQTRSENHHIVAYRSAVNVRNNPFLFYPKYAFFWLFAHLNFSTSFFWIQVILSNISNQWAAFKGYATHEQNATFTRLFHGSLLFIPNAFLLAAAPLLILMTWVYGLSSLPFTLVRSFCMHGPISGLKHYGLLKFLDILELIKDGYCFFVYATPVFIYALSIITPLIPAGILYIGTIISFIAIFILWIILESQAHYHYYDGSEIETLWALASTNFFRFAGAVTFMGVGIYLGAGVIAHALAPYMPAELGTAAAFVLAPFAFVISMLGTLYKRFIVVENSTVDLRSVIPNTTEAPTRIELPLVKVTPLRERKEALETRLIVQMNAFHRLPKPAHLNLTGAEFMTAKNKACQSRRDLLNAMDAENITDTALTELLTEGEALAQIPLTIEAATQQQNTTVLDIEPLAPLTPQFTAQLEGTTANQVSLPNTAATLARPGDLQPHTGIPTLKPVIYSNPSLNTPKGGRLA